MPCTSQVPNNYLGDTGPKGRSIAERSHKAEFRSGEAMNHMMEFKRNDPKWFMWHLGVIGLLPKRLNDGHATSSSRRHKL